MKVACPSCQALFEADDSPAAGPGLLLCEACSGALGDAPPLPPPPPVEGRRKRPQMPEIHFRPRRGAAGTLPEVGARELAAPASEAAPAGPAAAEPTPGSGERGSLGDLEVASDASRGAAGPAVLDGGFGRSEEPVSVFPGAPRTRRGAELSLGDYGSDVEPVSLHDLSVVLAPPRLPAAWSGSAAALGSSKPAEADAPKPAPRAKGDEPPKPAPAAKKAKDTSKPSFFQVDSIPPPPSSKDVSLDGLALEEASKPSSRRSDIRDLIRPRLSDRPKRGLDLAGLTGGLFDELPQPDQGPLAEPIALDALDALDVPASDQLPPRPAAARPARIPRAPAPRAPRSPAPVVADRGAAKQGGGAGSVVAFVAAGVVVGIAAFQLGARMAPPPSGPRAETPPAEAQIPAATSPPRVAPAPAPSPAPVVAGSAAPARPTAEARPDRAPAAEAPRAPREVIPAKDTARPAARPPAQPAATEAPAPPPPPPGGGPFDGAVAGAALAKAAASAAGCRQGDDPSGGARVSITFAPSGRVTSARVVGPPFQGTRTGGCIALSFGSASVPAFAGDPVTVSTDVNVR